MQLHLSLTCGNMVRNGLASSVLASLVICISFLLIEVNTILIVSGNKNRLFSYILRFVERLSTNIGDSLTRSETQPNEQFTVTMAPLSRVESIALTYTYSYIHPTVIGKCDKMKNY